MEFAVSNELETEVSYFLYNNPVYNSLSSLPLEKNRIIGETKVKVISLKDVFKNYLPNGQKIDFLTIDVEGHDFSVLKSMLS